MAIAADVSIDITNRVIIRTLSSSTTVFNTWDLYLYLVDQFEGELELDNWKSLSELMMQDFNRD